MAGQITEHFRQYLIPQFWLNCNAMKTANTMFLDYEARAIRYKLYLQRETADAKLFK